MYTLADTLNYFVTCVPNKRTWFIYRSKHNVYYQDVIINIFLCIQKDACQGFLPPSIRSINIFYSSRNMLSIVLNKHLCCMMAVTNQRYGILMSAPHKIIKLVFKFLVVKTRHEVKLLHSNASSIVLYSLVDYSMPTVTNDALLGKIVCDTVQEPDCKLVRRSHAMGLLVVVLLLLLLGGPDGDYLSAWKEPASQLAHEVDGVDGADDRDLLALQVCTNLVDTTKSGD